MHTKKTMHTERMLSAACEGLRDALHRFNRTGSAWDKVRVETARERVAMLTRGHLDAMARQAIAKSAPTLRERAIILTGGAQ